MDMRRPAALVLAAFALAACDGGGVVLVVDLKTDYVAGRQFFGVRTEVGDPELASIVESEDTFASAAGDYLHGERVAELKGLSPGTVAVRVTLMDALGQPLATRTTITTLSAHHALTVLITSSCEGVTCPGPSDDPSFTACLGGACVDPRCSPEMPEFCGALQCQSDAQCPSPVPCGDGLCSEGVCFVRVDDARCGANEQCDLRDGCVLRPDADAGPGCPPVETACADGIDDDCDGAIDCADPDCDGASCDDGSACTEGDTCSEGECTGAAVECDDGNPCTDDTCDPSTGCAHANNTVTCDDGNACTVNDTCNEGVCTGAALDCDDANPCTDDACDPATGCTYTNNTNDCDNGFWCDGPDRCSGGTCLAVGPSPCPAFCNESAMACEECRTDSDCGSPTYGAWSACGGYSDTCDETGTQSRSVMTPRCMAGMCTVVTTTESRSCTRDTDGTSCGTTTYGAWSSCGGFADACDETGTQTRTRTEQRCEAGACTPRNFTESRSCTRSRPDGTSCGSNTWMRCCSGVCRDLRTNAHCGGCGVNCNAIGLTCASTGTGGYSCRGCSTNAQCRSILNSSATCYDIAAPPAWCQCQCASDGVCANGGCGANMYCHDCPGTNFCAPFAGSC
ncbi:MAG TPA: hypothetical protein VIL20_14175 [Sandaracinaceae bacterium]